MNAGDVFNIETPGGGGYGKEEIGRRKEEGAKR
jgi:N-methylhydantoinase B/oxoprolinase/acetone carboxylase alpha subunit